MAKLDKWTAVWILAQVTPAPRVRVSASVIVISQLAWWVESGPQAGEKLSVEMATPLTAELVGPKPPPKLTAPTRGELEVSSAQNLTIMSARVTAEEPVLTTSKFSWFWLEPQFPNSFSCNARELVPQTTPPVGVGVAVKAGVKVKLGVAVTVEVAVLVGVAVAVDAAVRVGVGVAVAAAPVGVRVAVWVGVEVEVRVGEAVTVDVDVRVAVEVAVPAAPVGVKLAVRVGVFVGEAVAVKLGLAVAVEVGVMVGVEVAVPEGVPDGVAVNVEVTPGVGVRVGVELGVLVAPPGVQVATGLQEGGTPPEAVTKLPW